MELRSRSDCARRPAVLTPGEFFLIHEREHRLAWFAEHGHGEAHRDVVAVVAVLVVDDVATRLPERLASLDDTGRLTLELEHHLALQHVAEARSGVPMRRGARIARWELDDDRHRVRARRDERRLRFLNNGNRRLPRVRLWLLAGRRVDIRHGRTSVQNAMRSARSSLDRSSARALVPHF